PPPNFVYSCSRLLTVPQSLLWPFTSLALPPTILAETSTYRPNNHAIILYTRPCYLFLYPRPRFIKGTPPLNERDFLPRNRTYRHGYRSLYASLAVSATASSPR
ncbi:hypothetical protein BC937DRAFT_86657, partial [Endogone sp. FLAS-F59071]